MKEITPQQVEQMMTEGKQLNIIDVREVSEMAEGRIPGAVNIPLSLLEFRMHELDKQHSYIVVCRSGGRSGKATQYLSSYSYDVINMQGGMLEWNGAIEY